MYQTTKMNCHFDYKNKVEIIVNSSIVRYGTFLITGKLKNKEAYVIKSITSSSLSIPFVLGYPNRHVELEWGQFSGGYDEFIIDANRLRVIE